LHVVTCGDSLLPEFAFYLSISDAFRKVGEGWMYGAGGQKRVPEQFVKDFPFRLPPLTAQRSIVAFLSHRLTEIDDLIAKKRRLLELLAEKRAAIITRAVTKGLNPDAPMKPSGIDWLGDIPAHWEISKIKFISACNRETLPESTEPDYDLEYVDIGSVSLSGGIGQSQSLQFENAPSRARRIARDGDVIVSTVRTYLRAIATVSKPPTNLIVSTGFAVLSPADSMDPAFFGFFCISDPFVNEVVTVSKGVSYPAATPADIVAISVVVPPIEEQVSIAKHLHDQIDRLDQSGRLIEEAIGKLTEYRSALIAKAVTGELELA